MILEARFGYDPVIVGWEYCLFWYKYGRGGYYKSIFRYAVGVCWLWLLVLGLGCVIFLD